MKQNTMTTIKKTINDPTLSDIREWIKNFNSEYGFECMRIVNKDKDIIIEISKYIIQNTLKK